MFTLYTTVTASQATSDTGSNRIYIHIARNMPVAGICTATHTVLHHKVHGLSDQHTLYLVLYNCASRDLSNSWSSAWSPHSA